MPIKRAANSGAGILNRNFPFWELGGTLYWKSSSPTYVQESGGTGVVTHAYNGMHPYYHYVPGKGRFDLVTPGSFSALVNVTGTTIVRSNGPTGAGTLTYTVGAPKQLAWTAPGDAIGTAVNVGTGTYTLRSADTSLWLRVTCVNGSLPVANKSDVITCSSTNKVFPHDGFVPPARTNYWDDSLGAARGFTTVDAALTATAPAIGAELYILDPTTTGLVNKYRIANTSGGAARLSSQQALSATYSKAFSILMKRSDAGVIDASVATLYIAATHAGAHEGGATVRFKKIRSDGWYEVSVIHPIKAGSPTYYLGVELADTYTIDIEAPGVESYGTTIWAGTNPSPYMSTSTINSSERADHILYINRRVSAGTAYEPYPAGGFIAATLVHPYPATWGTLPAGTAFAWDVDNDNRFRLIVSSTYQTIAADMDSVAIGQLYLYSVAGLPITIGKINGIVVTWGRRLNLPYAVMHVNGQEIDLSTNFRILPTGIPDRYRIGYRYDSGALTNGDYLAAKVQTIVVGRSSLMRSEGRALSTWLMRQAISDIA